MPISAFLCINLCRLNDITFFAKILSPYREWAMKIEDWSIPPSKWLFSMENSVLHFAQCIYSSKMHNGSNHLIGFDFDVKPRYAKEICYMSYTVLWLLIAISLWLLNFKVKQNQMSWPNIFPFLANCILRCTVELHSCTAEINGISFKISLIDNRLELNWIRS